MVVEWDSRSYPIRGPKTTRASPRRPATGFVLLASTGRCEPGSVGDGRDSLGLGGTGFSDGIGGFSEDFLTVTLW